MIRKSMWYMVISIILFFVTEGFYIASADKIGNIVSIVWLLSIVILIVLLLYTLVTIYRQTYEKRIIKEMYKIYWCKKIVITPNKVWFKSNMLEGIGTLFSDFIKKSKKIAKKDVWCITFGNVYEKNKENIKIAKPIIVKAVALFVVMTFETFTPIVNDIFHYGYNISYIYIYWIQVLIPIVFFIKNMLQNKENIRYINFFQKSKWGYYYIGEEKVKFISQSDSTSKLYGQYLMYIKSIIAFFNLAMNMRYEDMETYKAEQYGIDCMIENVRNNLKEKRDAEKNDMVYAVIPILICGCFSKAKKGKIKSEIQGLFQDMQLSRDEKKFIVKTSLCVLRDFLGNDNEYCEREMEYKKMLLSFMKEQRKSVEII